MKSLKVILVSLLFLNTAIAQSLKSYVYQIGGGTAFLVTAKSGKIYLLTNWHVCRVASEFPVFHESVIYPVAVAKVVDMAPTSDLCLLSADNARLGLTLARTSYFGERVITSGHPGLSKDQVMTQGELEYSLIIDLPYPAVSNKCEAGFTSADLKTVQNSIMKFCMLKILVQDTSLKGIPGASGSPVVDKYGKLVGVVNHVKPSTEGYSTLGIIPLTAVREYLNKF